VIHIRNRTGAHVPRRATQLTGLKPRGNFLGHHLLEGPATLKSQSEIFHLIESGGGTGPMNPTATDPGPFGMPVPTPSGFSSPGR